MISRAKAPDKVISIVINFILLHMAKHQSSLPMASHHSAFMPSPYDYTLASSKMEQNRRQQEDEALVGVPFVRNSKSVMFARESYAKQNVI